MTNLERLPERIDQLTSQFVQLRTEIRDEFSAVREELASQIGELASQIGAGRKEFGGQITGLRGDIEEARRHMRVLHEDVISRLALIQEGQVTRRPSPRRKPK